MFWPWKSTSPSTRASGIVSCIRLRQRSSVDLPHPDGPMIAVTSFDGKSRVTSRTACVAPKYAWRARVCIAGAVGRSKARGDSPAVETLREAISVIRPPVLRAHHEARDHADHEYEGDENQRARPRLRMPFVVWADGVREHLEGQRGDGLGQLRREELIAERREEQGSGLARDARD